MKSQRARKPTLASHTKTTVPTRAPRPFAVVQESSELTGEGTPLPRFSFAKLPIRSPTPQSERPIPARAVIQAKMGFEFESGRNKLTNRPSKYLAGTTASGVRIEADTGYNIEFVTAANRSRAQIVRQVTEAATVAGNLTQAAQTGGVRDRDRRLVVNVPNGPSHGAHWVEAQNIRVGDGAFHASVQSSEGVSLDQFRNLMTEHLSAREVGRVAGRTDQLEGDLRVAAGIEPKVKGLLDVIVMYLLRAQHDRAGRPAHVEGPKTSFRLMHRSDFKAMYESLNRRERTQFRQALIGQNRLPAAPNNGTPISQRAGLALDDRVFHDQYLGGPNPQTGVQPLQDGPTLREWIGSIFLGRADSERGAVDGLMEQRDLLSPPPGWANHADVAAADRYGMGAYAMDPDNDQLAILEMRGYRSKLKGNGALLYGGNWQNRNGKIPRTQWVAFVHAVVTSAMARGDMQA